MLELKLKELTQHQNVIIITTIGKMQSGKTTFSLHLGSIFEEWGYYCIYVNSDFEEIVPYLHDFEFPVYLLFDDISFYFTSFQKSIPFQKFIARIYHFLKNKVIINFVLHYSKAILPFLRLSDCIFLLSLTTPEELDALTKFFFPNDLWNYYHTYTHQYFTHPILAKVLNYTALIPTFLPEKPKFILDKEDLLKREKDPEIMKLFDKKYVEMAESKN
jgi:hypothetical protein